MKQNKETANSKKKFTPLYDRVIIKRDEAPDYVGAIVIPDAAKEKMQRGTVVAAGTGRVSDLTNEIRPMSVKPGDRVIFGKYTGDPIEIEGVEFLMLREDAIYLLIHD